MIKNLIVPCGITMLFGCASDLRITGSDTKTALPGVPVGAPILVEVETTKTYKPVGTPPNGCDLSNYCGNRVSSEAKFLPLGKTYYVNFDAATFAKSEFSLTFAETGILTGVSLNSTPSTDALTALLETVLPFVKAPKIAPAPPAVSPAPGAPVCPWTVEEVFEKHCVESSATVTSVEEIKVKLIQTPSTSPPN